MARHVVLFGDSIFDNAAYIDGGPDVAAQLREALDPEDRVTLKAVDGSISEQVEGHLGDCPTDATHIVISSGGNDILHHAAMLEQPCGNMAAAMDMLSEAQSVFAPAHRSLVEAAKAFAVPTAICTIYDANMGPHITTAMAIFNDAITRNIHRAGLDLIDLRMICDEASDYANPIEPSVTGGAKIASAIATYVSEVEAKAAQTRVFAR
ncbi:SGNH/GDSL hydrolase family protein [Erythrobacter sp. EC-HK427]|uniref:SGNH/GDSL hydrolase family protein n=1 Tax=Erythrobacter sp. EC-HK427 TaxID=2038396 RepID=UPI0012575AE9|nr:SGNH/GDSL hydrolase family protein [Erythrobacter sp. EC-HK427]VVT13727.1 Lipase [Erythrobacter sp. EC-HK427]